MCLFVNTPMYPTGTSTGTDSVSKTYTQIFSISIQLPGGDIGVRNIFLTLITLIQFNSIQQYVWHRTTSISKLYHTHTY